MAKAEPTTAAKANVRISDAKAFAEFCRANDETQADMYGHLIRWFLGLDKTTRTLVLRRLNDEDMVAVSMIALRRIIEQAAIEPGEETDLFHPGDLDALDRLLAARGQRTGRGGRREKKQGA